MFCSSSLKAERSPCVEVRASVVEFSAEDVISPRSILAVSRTTCVEVIAFSIEAALCCEADMLPVSGFAAGSSSSVELCPPLNFFVL